MAAVTTRMMTFQQISDRLSGRSPRGISRADAPRRAAVALIFQPGPDSQRRLLFIRRAEQEGDPWSGHMAFPGGSLEASDASALEAARRETREEVGVDLARGARLLGRLDDVRASAGGRVIPMAITPFVFALEGEAAPHTSPEVQEVLWVPVGALLDPAARSSVPWEHGGQRYDLPCIRHQGQVIWGLTYQMLMTLFELLGWRAEESPC